MNNPQAHERTTGPEIWRQTEGRVTHVVIASGTGGTITGVGHYLKAQNPAISDGRRATRRGASCRATPRGRT